jgi:cytochrome c-type biogenesis protein CcmF
MVGTIGHLLITGAFGLMLAALFAYWYSDRTDRNELFKTANWLYGLSGLLVLGASSLLVYLIFTHQFNFYYVYNYTSTDLQTKYLLSAFYGGQEGSFMLWILFSTLVGLGLMRWTGEPYRKPVLFVMALTQVFLLSMVLGVDLGSVHIGASPFRSLAEAMPNAPFLQQNPGFVPPDGKGLNDLLKSPWMMIHPPILFLGFSMMTVPFAFAISSLWKRKYQEWVNPALPWTLGANLCLLTAIFLGGYWAYVTLSFGGYWAWDPVENASLVPWLFGTAGIHTMIIQRKSTTSQKASIIFALVGYLGIVYETFLTRSGILADSSVHSFVDLGLYNQLLLFMFVTTLLSVGMMIYRRNELPKPKETSKIFSREFMTFAGAMILFLLGLVIILGTSSPVLGKLFVSNPTPPEMSFYNEWSMPLVMIAAVLTVLGQYLFWNRMNGEELASALLVPLVLTSVATLGTIFIANIRDIYEMVYLLTGFFALFGNGAVMLELVRKSPTVIGGTVSHVGFALLLLGILGSSIYSHHLLDQKTQAYNKAVVAGKVTGKDGFPVTQKIDMVELKLDEPKLVNNKYLMTYEGYTLENQARPGQQAYRIKFADPDNDWDPFYMYPQVYPMRSGPMTGAIEWSVDPDVHTGLSRDIYMYVAGSAFVERRNNQAKRQAEKNKAMQNASMQAPAEEDTSQTITIGPNQSVDVGSLVIKFHSFGDAEKEELPVNTQVGVKAHIEVVDRASGHSHTLHPIFAVVDRDGESWTYSPALSIEDYDLSLQFVNVNPGTGQIDLKLTGVKGQMPEQDWVLVIAEEKPFVSVVWAGTFILMLGFSISIFRRWADEKRREEARDRRAQRA